MKRFSALCGATIGWALGVVLPSYGQWPLLSYHPAKRIWFIASQPGPLAMGYYGLLLYGMGGVLAGAGIGSSLGALLSRRGPPLAGTFWLGTAWTLTALVIVAAYYTFNLWPPRGSF